MGKCKNYNSCYENAEDHFGIWNSQACNNDTLAQGYCGIRKEQVAPLKKSLEIILEKI